MAFMTEALQIGFVVEKRTVTAVRHDVVNVRRQREDALLQTLLTMRMLREKTVAQYLPAVAVPPFGRRAFLLAPTLETNLMGFLFCLSVSFCTYHQMLRAETLTARHGVETPRKLTKRHQWHGFPPAKVSMSSQNHQHKGNHVMGDFLVAVLKLFMSLIMRLSKSFQSLRASGTSFDPEIGTAENGVYHVCIHITPGNDEVVFESLKVPGCQISNTTEELFDSHDPDIVFLCFKHPSDGKYYDAKLPIQWVIPPASRYSKTHVFHICIKPTHPTKRVKFVLSGGWFNQLSANRVLPTS